MNLNRIVLIGRLCADPEERHSNDGMAIAKFRVAVSRRGKPREGQPEADFFNVVCFRQTAEFVSQYLHRGYLVAVEGACHIDDYTDKDGQKQRWVEVQADNVQNLTPRGAVDDVPEEPHRRSEEPRRETRSREQTRRRDFADDDGRDPFNES